MVKVLFCCSKTKNSATKNPALFCSENKSEVHFEEQFKTIYYDLEVFLKKLLPCFTTKQKLLLI